MTSEIDEKRLECKAFVMKTISVRDMKAQGAEIERQVLEGETFEVLNRGRPAAMIVPPRPTPPLFFAFPHQKALTHLAAFASIASPYLSNRSEVICS